MKAELTNRLLDHEPGVDSETAEEWGQPFLTKDGRKGTAFFILDKADYPEDAVVRKRLNCSVSVDAIT